MKYITNCLLLFFVFTNGLCSAQQNYQLQNPKASHLDEAIRVLKNSKDPHVLVTAHRGDWRNAPENSIMAIQNAIVMGVDIVEIDLHQTKDGQLILMHDPTIDRTTNGKGKVSDWTLDSLKTLYLKDGLSSLTPYKIPTLEEALKVIKGNILVNLDQSYDYFAKAYDILKRTGTMNQAIMKSNHPVQQVVAENGRYLKEMMYMAVVNLDSPDALKIIKDYQTISKPIAFELIFKRDTSSVINMVSKINRDGSKFWVNSLWDSLCAGHNDERALISPDSNYGWMLKKGFQIIQTDRPVFLIDYLKRKQLHN